MTVGVLLVDPKFPHNVGNVLRACALLDAQYLWWTGSRVAQPDRWPSGARLPREERMRAYRRTSMQHTDVATCIEAGELAWGMTPVCIELTDGAEDLRYFDHPENALYIFGPEDGSVPKGVRHVAHRFVRIPNAVPDGDPSSRTPFNLSAAVNIVLFHRLLARSLVAV